MRNSLLGVHSQSVDGESLQTDVMRFMAIIAFCLIAILALVRNVEPAPAASNQKPAASNQKPAASNQKPAASNQKPVAPDKAKAPAVSEPAAPNTATAPPLLKPTPAPPMPVRLDQIPSVPVREKVVRVKPIPKAAARIPGPIPAPMPTPVQSQPPLEVPNLVSRQAPPEPSAAAKRGLSLRFASDREFMSLVTKGEIQVYAFQQGAQVLGLARNFEFNQAPAPGRLYELLPDTIPRLVVSALHRATGDAGAFTWGIRLPPKLEGRIRRYVDQDAAGELVIDRFGQVHHVPG